ncbi:hypothetical protein [Pseudomonas aeruginosa]|uniref:hypothetical protein n=1 Tax=Pseudomonas aeruginosa TaxID=287 RepID=UPI001C1E1DD6|nr:hypothetical protein [Pseudomonas aeruginosa]
MEKLFAFPVEKKPSAIGGKALDGVAGFLPIGERAREKALWNAPRRCVAKLWTVDPPMAPPSMLPPIAADFPGKPENPVFMDIMASKGEVLETFSRAIPFRGFPVEKLLANRAGSAPPGLPQGFGRTVARPGEIVLPCSSERLSISCG